MLSRAVLLGCLLAASSAHAALEGITLEDIVNARAVGMGGAFRASGAGAEATVGNPAALAAYKAYNAELSGGWDIDTKVAFVDSLVRDSVTSQLAAGAGYSYISSGHGANRETTSYSTIALALPLGDVFMIGASGHYLLRTGADPANAVTGDAGMLVKIASLVNLGITAHNLVYTGHMEMSRYYSAEAALYTGVFNLSADLQSELLLKQKGFQPKFMGGAEFVIAQAVPLRAGYTYDGSLENGRNFISFGAGFLIEGSGVDAAYRMQLGGDDKLLLVTVHGQF